MPFALAATSLVLTAASTAQQYRAARNAAKMDSAVAGYNAKVDEARAQQLDLDTLQNIRTHRENDAVYLSQQHAAYASAGVLATSGSPLHAVITNAGRMEQQIQQEYVNSQQKQQQFYSSAKAGILEGEARASSDRTQGTIALIDGGARMARSAFSDYQSGVFGSTPKIAHADSEVFG